MDHLVLVIDDEAVIRELMERHLTAIGCKVVTAANAEEGARRASEAKPDLVFMDIRMPGMGGIKGLKNLRRLYHDLKVVMLTAIEDMRVAQNAINQGALQYIHKPIDLPTITQLTYKYLPR